MSAGDIAFLILIAAIIAWCATEAWAIKTGRKTISADTQGVTALMDKPMIGGIAFGLGALAMWFVYHFLSAPPT
jgi:hypothetical protein